VRRCHDAVRSPPGGRHGLPAGGAGPDRLGMFIYRPLVDTFFLAFTDWNMVRAERT
jgi:hypothetical protein